MHHSAIEPLESRIAPATIFALTENQNLLEFDAFVPGKILHIHAITGIERGDTLLAIDYDVHRGTLLGAGAQRFYEIDPATGFAEIISHVSHEALLGGGRSFSAELNPFDQTIRVITDTDQSYRFSRVDGSLLGTDTQLNPATVAIAGLGFSVNSVGSAPPTLFAIDAVADTLVRIGGPGGTPSPNGGTVTTIGPLGLDVAAGATDLEVISNVEAFAIDFSGGTSRLHHIDLATGATSLVGDLGGGEKVIGFASRHPAKPLLASYGKGQPPLVYGFNPDGSRDFTMLAFEFSHRGGVRLAQGDVNGDGTLDILAATYSGAPRVRVFDGITHAQLAEFTTRDLAKLGFRGGKGIYITANDLDGDGTHELILGSGTGKACIGVFDGATGAQFTGLGQPAVFSPGKEFRGGVEVAAGDVNGDGRADIIVGAGPGGGPHVKVFSGLDRSVLHAFQAFQPKFHGGITVAAGDVNGDGRVDIITGIRSKGPAQVNVFSGADAQQLGFILLSAVEFKGGVSVSAVDLNGDGKAEILACTSLFNSAACDTEAIRFQITSPLLRTDTPLLPPIPPPPLPPGAPSPLPPPPPPPPPPASH